MIDVVINYDPGQDVFKLYEPSTDTLLITSSLGETFIKLSEFLKSQGMIATDILAESGINYHIDSATFLRLIESNVNLLKRLSSAPSGFALSQQKFGITNQGGPGNSAMANSAMKFSTKKQGGSFGKSGKGGFGSKKSAFGLSNKKFGN